jgi:triosephosphate isomerase
LKGVSKSVNGCLTVAYEPVWAIGTGRNAAPAQVMETHGWIRRALVRRFGAAQAQQIPILYGGSVNPGNARELAMVPEVDGVLVGGASLDHRSFAEIVNAFSGQQAQRTKDT